MLTPENSAVLPVGSPLPHGPVFVPLAVQRPATRSPSARITSTFHSRSGNAARKSAAILRCPSGPGSALELPPIGWQLFILGNSKSDSTAFPLFLDTYATRLLAEPLSRAQVMADVVLSEDLKGKVYVSLIPDLFVEPEYGLLILVSGHSDAPLL